MRWFKDSLASTLLLILCSHSPLYAVSDIANHWSDFYAIPDISLDDHWKKVGFSFNLVKKLLTIDHCYSDESIFLACVEALNAIAHKQEEPLIFTAQEHLLTDPHFGRVIKDFEGLSLVEHKNSPFRDFIEDFKFLKEAHRKSTAFWKQHFGNEFTLSLFSPLISEALKLNLNTILSWLETNLITKNSESNITAAAINGYLNTTIDPHTNLFPREFIENEIFRPKRDYIGIGIGLQLRQGSFVIQNLVKEGPAIRAGLRVGDIITRINGKDISNLSNSQVGKLLEGEEGANIALTITRGELILTITVPLKKIVIDNISHIILKDRNRSIGYLKQSEFSATEDETSYSSCYDMQFRIDQMATKNHAAPHSLIYDLRGNRGGLLSEGLCIASIFLKAGLPIATKRALSGNDDILETYLSNEGFKYRAPLIILINDTSASASEIVSGALQDHQRAIIIGERSYGKGSIQHIMRHDLPHVVLLQTVARFYLPSGRTTQIHGIIPDITVYEKPIPTEEDIFGIREEDLFTNVLPAVGEPWTQSRPDVIQALERCAEETGLAKQRYEEGKSNSIPPDYQLLYAQDVMTCLLEH